MKKCFKRFCLLGMALCLLAGCALADNGTILDTNYGASPYYSVTSVAVLDDTAYFLVYNGEREEIWSWQKGMPEMQKVAGDFRRGSDYLTIDKAEEQVGEESARYAIVALLSDGERLLGLNHLNGLIYEIRIADGEALCEDVVKLEDNSFFYRNMGYDRWYWSPENYAVSGDYLYWNGKGWSEETQKNVSRITRISLVDGSCLDLAVTGAAAVCSYKEGKLLILRRDSNRRNEDGKYEPYEVCVYNPADESLEKAEVALDETVLNYAAYSPELDALIYQSGMTIRGCKALGEPQVYAYVNANAGIRMGVMGDQLFMYTTDAVIVRDLVEGLKAPDSLRIYGSSLDTAGRRFAARHTDVPLNYESDKKLGEYATIFQQPAGEEIVDLARFSTNAGRWELQELIDAEVLLDLSVDPEIRAYVDALYPAFRDLVTRDGKIWALPTHTVSYTGTFINRKAMQDLGLTLEEMPTNLVELCAFVNRWNEEFAEKYPNYACIEYTENVRWYLLDMMVEMWIAHCQAAGEELHFNDPAFREMMAALEKVEAGKTDASMKVTDPEVSDYKTGLFWMRCQLVGNWAGYMEETSDRIFIPMTLTEDTPYFATVDGVTLWTVNRATDSQEYALELLREEIAAMDEKYTHVLLTTETEPVESPYYAGWVKDINEEIDRYSTKLEETTDEEKRAELESIIAELQQRIDVDFARSRYSITASAIGQYVNVLAPVLHIQQQNVLENNTDGISAMESLMDRWLDGAITTEQFIREADARVMMLEMAE